MSASLVTVCYIAAIILFILSLGGLSNPESSRRGNLYGMIGMTIAVLATIFGPRVTSGGIGVYLARTVQMTQMPELVAFMHSLVGLAAMVVGFASYIDPGSMFDLVSSAPLSAAEKTIHHIEVYVGILIGALVQIAPPAMAGVSRPDEVIRWLAVAGIGLTAINMFGGFAVTQRMLSMFRK